MTHDQERWKEAPGLDGYMVSGQGRMAKLMSTKPSRSMPYVQFSIPDGRGGKRLRRYLHDLVLLALAGPKPEGSVVRHLNDVPTDNRLENLQYGTYSENQRDIWVNGIRTPKTHCNYGHALEGENQAPGNRCRTCQRERAAKRREVVGP